MIAERTNSFYFRGHLLELLKLCAAKESGKVCMYAATRFVTAPDLKEVFLCKFNKKVRHRCMTDMYMWELQTVS